MWVSVFSEVVRMVVLVLLRLLVMVIWLNEWLFFEFICMFI